MLDVNSFAPGKVTYNSFNISFDIPFEDQIDSLNEDLMQVEYEGGFIIDIGWYPEMDPAGNLSIQLIHECDWDKPVRKIIVTSMEELYAEITLMKETIIAM